MEPYQQVHNTEVDISQPQVPETYNSHMGGVDHHDWLVEKMLLVSKARGGTGPNLHTTLVNAWPL
jgi:hypothetical protein